MDEIVAKKTETENKLLQDEAKLRHLKESLEKSDQLTNNMVTILESFTKRLKKMDDHIRPLYEQTLRLTRLQKNVWETLDSLDEVVGFHQVVDEVEPRIREGPGGSVEGYIKLLEHLNSALEFFNRNNPSSVELSHINALFETGLQVLSKEFLSILKRYSTKVIPLQILNDIAASETVEDMPPLDQFPAAATSDLQAIAKYLLCPGRSSDITQYYHQIRSSHLGRALNSLKEARSGPSLVSSQLPKKSSFNFLKAPSPAKRTVVKKGQEAHGSGQPGSDSASGVWAGVDEQLEGCSYFLTSTTVFLRLMQAEVRLMEQIFPPPHRAHILDKVTETPVKFFIKEGDALLQHAKRCIARHEYPVVIAVFRVIKLLQTLLPEYRDILSNLNSETYEQFPFLISQFEKLNMKALEDYTTHIRGNPEKQSNLPKDGTVHELTSNTMWFAEQLLDYWSILGEVSLKQSSFEIRVSRSEKKYVVGSLLTRVLDSLNMNLENKARSYENPFLGAIFLMNNYHFIHKSFTKNELMLQLLEEVLDDVEERYNGLVEEQRKSYQKCFSKLLQQLGQESAFAHSSTDKLSKQQRHILKDRFKGFNTEFEELHRIQEYYSIPDPRLRNMVREDNVELIVPCYTEFYRQYAGMRFTSNPDKYLRYTPERLEEVLRSFFDGGVA